MNLFKKKAKEHLTILNCPTLELSQTIEDIVVSHFSFDISKISFIFEERLPGCLGCGMPTKENSFLIYISPSAINSLDINNSQQMNSFKNTIYHELVHAQTFFSQNSELKNMRKSPDCSFSKWAFMIVDDYKAYHLSNVYYPETPDSLKSKQGYNIRVYAHYCNRLNPGPSAFEYFDSFYDLATSFIAEKFVDPAFPYYNDKNYLNFINSYLGHIEEANDSPQLYQSEQAYHQLGLILMDDFLLLFPFALAKYKTQFPQMQSKYFKINSHMN